MRSIEDIVWIGIGLLMAYASAVIAFLIIHGLYKDVLAWHNGRIPWFNVMLVTILILVFLVGSWIRQRGWTA